MARLRFALLLFCVALASAPADLAAREGEEAAPVVVKGRFEEAEGRRVLTLWGTPKERGVAQGYLLGERILSGLERDLSGALGPLLVLYKNLVRTVVVGRFAFDEEESAELEGIMEGIRARVPKERLVLAPLGREVDLLDLKALNTFGDWYGLGCSSVAVWGERTRDGRPLVGRNFDFPGFELIIGQQVVVVRAPCGEARGQVGVSYPGCIGTLTGMSEAGVFVAIHDVRVKPPLLKAVRPNVPRLVAVRRLLERISGVGACAQARDLARTWPTLYGNNLMVVGPGGEGAACAAVLEYDNREEIDGGCSMRTAEGDGAPCLVCTNHHHARPELPVTGEVLPRWRYDVLSRMDGEAAPAAPFDVGALFAWMSKAAFPAAGEPQQAARAIRGPARHHGTLHQVVGEPARRRLHVTLGRLGANIRDLEPQSYDVAALVRAAAEAAKPPDEGR